jgi:TRAP-type C4-dicarboxylate transport system permease large subunit
MALSSLVVLLWGDYNLLIIIQRLFSGSDNFILTAVPSFVLAGGLMTVGGITPRLMGFAQSLVGHVRGGLCFVMIIGEMILSGITGSATADTAAIGSLMIPAMEKEGYDKKFACSLTTLPDFRNYYSNRAFR